MKRFEFHKSKYKEVTDAFSKYFGTENVRWWIDQPDILIKTDTGLLNDRFSIVLDCTEEEYKKLSFALVYS